jgi:hypothetical protein
MNQKLKITNRAIMVDAIRTIILPILLIALAVVVGMRYTETFFDIGTIGSGGDSNVGSNSSNILFGTAKNKITNNVGSNVSSNITSSSSTSSLYNNILGKIADNSIAELTFDMLYDGRSKDKTKDKTDYISQEHKDASKAQEDAISRRDVKDMIQNELLNKLGSTTANQMYFDDQEECDDCSSPATQQGCEMDESNKSRKRPQIDMNQYVRKDSIPCWGCNLE